MTLWVTLNFGNKSTKVEQSDWVASPAFLILIDLSGNISKPLPYPDLSFALREKLKFSTWIRFVLRIYRQFGDQGLSEVRNIF